MSKITEQMTNWSGVFGKEYTDRNALSLEEMENLYRRNYGVTRTDLNKRFLEGMDHSIRILEVGSNIGNQLLCLQELGFTCLYGIELQDYAVELSKSRTRNINMIQGSVFDIPFKDSFFDLVFTSGLLIHISPADIKGATQEIHRCTSKWIWGFESYADRYEKITYRGNPDLFWKVDYAALYQKHFEDLELIREERLKYLEGKNLDSMFLLRKK